MNLKFAKTGFALSKVILLFLFGCTSTRLEPAITTLLPINTIAPSQTNRPQSTPTPQIIQTNTPIYNELLLTPLPSLEAAEARALVQELMATNAGCLFPCWWGITPGETPWNIAVNFLESFAQYSYSSGQANAKGDQSYYFEFIISPEIHNGTIMSVKILSNNGVVDEIASVQSINLQNILADLGQPAQIWLLFPDANFEERHYIGYYVILLYPGVMVLFADFVGVVELDEEDYLSVCPNQIGDDRFTKVWLWDLGIDRTILEISPARFQFRPLWSLKEGPTYLPLENATDYDVGTFYETFLDAKSQECFISPIKTWPEWSGLVSPP